MRLMHLSDLHIGKIVHGFSMIEDQKFILKKIIDIIDLKKVDGVIIAGDVYDRPVASVEATVVFEEFLIELSKKNIGVYIISGNHDSSQRLSFGSTFLKNSKIFISKTYDGSIDVVNLSDEYGDLKIFLMPFLKPIQVSRFFKDLEVKTYTDACSFVIDNTLVDEKSRNIMVSHQFITGGVTSESEMISIGGSDNVDVCVFDKFDYVALGHLHAPQQVLRETVRYCGTPLKYSFSEANHKKTACIIDFFEKGNIKLEYLPLVAKKDMVIIKGFFENLISDDFRSTVNENDYFSVVLLDEDEIVDVISKLRAVYPNIMILTYDNKRTRSTRSISEIESVETKSPLELFCEFYEMQNDMVLDDSSKKFVSDLIEEIWEGNK